MDEPRVVTSYEPFSEEPEYVEANRSFIASLPLASRREVLDLACGAGILSEMMFEANPALRIVQADLSREALLLTRDRLARGGYLGDGRHPGRSLGLVEASAAALPARAGSFDAVVMGNAIHILPDPDALLEEIRRVLRPKGILAFNTSFYAGTYPRGTEKFYHHWLMGALGFIARRGQELKQAGGPAIRRVRGTAARAFSRPWPARQEWCARLERKGFRVLAAHERTVMMDRRSFESVGAYAGLASVLLSGYPVELACEALQAAAAPAFAAIGATAVPRLWLEVTAITTNGESSHVD